MSLWKKYERESELMIPVLKFATLETLNSHDPEVRMETWDAGLQAIEEALETLDNAGVIPSEDAFAFVDMVKDFKAAQAILKTEDKCQCDMGSSTGNYLPEFLMYAIVRAICFQGIS